MERVPSFPLSYTNKHKAHTVGLCLPLRVCAFLSTALCVCVCVCVRCVFVWEFFCVFFCVCEETSERFSVFGLRFTESSGGFLFWGLFWFWQEERLLAAAPN
jgi:hypothetical protein